MPPTDLKIKNGLNTMSHPDIPSLSRRWIWLWLALLLAAGAYLRVEGVSSYYYSPDEEMHVRMAEGHDFMEVWRFSHFEAHPPIGNFIRHYWMLMGDNVAFVRGLSLLFGLLLMPLYYLIGRKINGTAAGIVCALFMTFSYGCIAQSYLARNYIILVFFLSSAFYAYLHWQTSHNLKALCGYAIGAVLAVFTHFSAIFCIGSIAAFEAIRLLRRSNKSQLLVVWLAVNAAIAASAVYVYHLWQPVLLALKPFFDFWFGYPDAFQRVISGTLEAPFSAANYSFFDHDSGYIILPLLLLYALGKRGNANTRLLVLLALTGFFCSMFLYAANIYVRAGGRHNLWLLPLYVPAAGAVASDIISRAFRRFLPGRLITSPPLQVMLMLAVLLFAISSDVFTARFADRSEYIWPRPDWQAFLRSVDALGPHDLIVAEKDYGGMLTNLYPYMDDSFSGRKMAAIAPYRNTHILLNPYYPAAFSTPVFFATLQEAKDRHMLEGIDRLVFVWMNWSVSPVADLYFCAALPKQIITFPAMPPAHTLSRGDMPHLEAVLLSISTKDLIAQVLAPDGAARSCLDGKHDIAPGLRPPGQL